MPSTESPPVPAVVPEPEQALPSGTAPPANDVPPEASEGAGDSTASAGPAAAVEAFATGSRATEVAANPLPAPTPAAKPAGLNPAECAQQLRQRFPALFSGAPKPLKLRIQVDIQERAPGVFTKPALSAFFRRYTGSTSYLLAIAKGSRRFDLDGQPAGEITDEHRQVAADELARRRANHEARFALEDQQRRNRAGLLHDFERTTLTRANFCALKEVAEEALDGLLAIARDEAAQPRGPDQRPARPANPGRRR